MKMQMGAVRFIHNNRKTVLFCQLYALDIVCCNALIGRVYQNQIFAVWIAFDILLQYFC